MTQRARAGLRILIALGGALLLFLIVACWHPLTATAATLTVTTTNDTVATGDGLSLRETILCINAGSNAPAADCPVSPSPGYGTSDTIQFTVPGTGAQTITLGSALPALAKSVAIDGTTQQAGIAVDGGCTLNGSGQCTSGGVRPFTVNSSVTAMLNGLTIQRGDAFNGDGGAILNNGTLTVTGCTFTNNASTGNANGGGAIGNNGTLTVNASNFAFSTAGAAGTASTQGGGAIYNNNGTLVIADSEFDHNSTGGTNPSGGAILDFFGTVTVTGSTFFANSTSGGGGAIDVVHGTLNLTNSTLNGNPAANGGAIDLNNSGAATLKNATVANNTATTQGGGIRVVSGSTLSMTNTIVAKDSGPTAANGPDVSGAATSGGTNLIGVVDGSTGFTGFDQTGTAASPLDPLLGPLGNYGGSTQTVPLLPSSPAIDLGNNTTCATTTGTAPVNNLDQRGVLRPQLDNCDIGAFESQGFVMIAAGANQAALENHQFGGALRVIVTSGHNEPVQGGRITFSNLAHTPGPSATISGNPATIDARGAASVTATADGTAGSYSFVALFTRHAVGAVFNLTNGQVNCTVDSTLDQGEAGKRTLRDAVDSANGSGCIGNVITFDATAFPSGTPTTVTLNAAFGTLTLNAAMTITGTGHRVVVDGGCTVNGSGQCVSGGVRVLIVNFSVNAAISGLTIKHGNNPSGGAGGGIEIFSGSTLTLTNCTIAANSSVNAAGGISNGGTLTVTNSTIAGNTASPGGGGGITNSSGSTLTVTNSTITGNNASLGGGGITNSPGGTLTVTNSTITGNSASLGEGGISNATGPATLVNTLVAGNTAPSSPDVGGTFTSGGHNLIGKKDGSTGFTAPGDLTGTVTTPLNPLLGALSSNGGPTQTIAPQSGSSAIDAGDPTVCAAALVNGKDQRGIARRGDRCSIGAFEADPAIPNVLPNPEPLGGTSGTPNVLPNPRGLGGAQPGPPAPLPNPRP